MTIDDKRFDFMMMVQAKLIEKRPIGWAGFMGDALDISYRIPHHLSARKAALEFLEFIEEKADLTWGLPLRR